MPNLFSSYNNFITFTDNLVFLFLMVCLPVILIVPFTIYNSRPNIMNVVIVSYYRLFGSLYVVVALLYIAVKIDVSIAIK